MISIRNYFTIIILMFMIFVMFMFVGVSSELLTETAADERLEEEINIGASDTITAASLQLKEESGTDPGAGRMILNPELKRKAAIVAKDTKTPSSRILQEWCVYNKYLFRVFPALPDAAELAKYDLVLFDDSSIIGRDTERLYAYAEQGVTLIFTQLPDYQELSADKKLADFFGIAETVAEEVTADGIKIYANFMLNKERIYQRGDYFGNLDDTQVRLPYYSLRAGYEVYAAAILAGQEQQENDLKLPPLLWRTYTGNSFVYVVNSDHFDGMSMLGILTGFLANQGRYYLYPIVNAQTISMIDYPYFSDENRAVMQNMYSRSAEAIARDILWPNIVQILKNFGGSYSFFASSQLNYEGEEGPKDSFLEFYLQEIDKLPGNMGLSLGQVSELSLQELLEQNEAFYQASLPQYKFSALYTAKFSEEEVKACLGQDFLTKISLVMSDYKPGDTLLSFLEEDVLSVKFNLEGTRHETLDDLQMICVENALGMCNMKMEIGRVFYPQSDRDAWNNLSTKWSREKTYFNDFAKLDMIPIYEMEKRVRRFLALDFTYEYFEDTIDIQIDHFDQEAYFILIAGSSRIDAVNNGKADRISDQAYLIKATAASVSIHLTEENRLKKPKDQKLLPSNKAERQG